MNNIQFGQGEVALLIRSCDWSGSPLGAPESWPQSLRTIVSLMLNSKFPMFLAWGPEMAIIYNDAYIDVLGQKHPRALGARFSDVWAEVWVDISPIIDKAMAGEPSYFENLPLTMRRKGYDEETWFTFSYSPVYDESGNVGGMYCACTETTAHVLAERHRTDENERLRDLFQQAPGIMAVLRSANHTFELANEAYHHLIGEREIIGKPVREALPEVAGQGLFELLDHVYETGEPYVGRAMPVKLQREHGELEQRYVDFIYQPIRDIAGAVTGIFVEGSDVTEAVQITEALRESEQRLRQLANTIPQLAWIANPDGYVHWFNDRFYDYTGTTLEDAEGWGWLNMYPPESRAQVGETYRTLIAEGEPFELTEPLRAANGEYRMFYTKVAPLHDLTGNIVQWFGTDTDIHEIEKVQGELRLANQRKDEFLAMLAHELRNPLAPISTAAELLKLATMDEHRVRTASTIISRQVEHLTDLVDDLLDVSRVTRGLVILQEVPVNLKEVVVDAVEQVKRFAELKHQAVDVVAPDEPVLVKGDRTRLVQIFSNILNNASRYTQDHGAISVDLRLDNDNVQVRIKDNGIGIDPDLLPHIFELFTQAARSPDRSQGGLGLGLSLVKSLVDLHRGTVTASSDGANKGSEFVVTLPRIHAAGDLSEAKVDRREGADMAPALKVMVVDDNVDAAQTLSMLLESQRYKVLAQYSATDAIKGLGEYKPDIVILDIGLPDMDGFELARRLKAMPQTKGTLFIALTGYGQSRDREQSRMAGFDHHLVKPVNIQRLLSLLSSASPRPNMS